ncbi:MAG: hypothetical protein H7X92_10745 [Chitinophagales bacterium]|nr:hypothetical protein [Hyphomicrobiales bacterium]
MIPAEIAKRRTEIERRFSASWDDTESFFSSLHGHNIDMDLIVIDIKTVISTLRIRNLNGRLRAGQSMHTLIFSRSYEHGLRYEQPRISITRNALKSGQTLELVWGSALKTKLRKVADFASDRTVDFVFEWLLEKPVN